MKWQILLPTVVDRDKQFKRLVDVLAPQLEKYKGDIQAVVLWNNYETELSALRQTMIESATAEYTNFIDDDDLVADDYCDSIYPLLDGVDYIGFKVAYYQNSQKQKPVIHSLSCSGWNDDGDAYERRGTLINPTRRTLMLLAGFKNSDYTRGIPEDITYANNVDSLLKSEHFVNKEIHLYLPTDDHAWSNFTPKEGTFKRPELPKYFSFHKDSTRD